MQPRTTAILFAIALALGAFVYLYEIRGGEARKAAEERSKQLFPEIEAADVTALWFETQDGQSARLERHEGTWRLVEPIRFAAEETAVEGMASSLADLASEGVIEEPQPSDVYGLGEGATVVHFLAREKEHTLRIGKRAPVGGNTYAAVEAEPAVVYTVPTFRVTGFSKNLADLREHLVLRFDQPSIRRIEASWPPDGRVTLERSDADDWALLEPLGDRADQDTVAGLLSDLRFLRASEFLDTPTSEARAALETPEFKVRLLGGAEEGEEPPVFELAIGAVLGDGRVVRSSAAPILFLVPPERLQDLPRRVVEYRYKDLAEFSILDAAKLELAFASETADTQEAVVILATRGDQGWTSTPERVQPGKLARLVSELSRLQASDIVAEALDDEGLAQLGLSPPATVVRVFAAEEGGEEPLLAELFFGRVDPDRGVFVRVPGRDTVYAIGAGIAEHVPVSLEAFRNRFVSQEEEVDAGADAPGAEG